MKVNEIFESIQGEGNYAGYPALFIRLSGCTRKCSFCDTKYHTGGEQYTITQLAKRIQKSDKNIVVWTGGEPLTQLVDVSKVINITYEKEHHLETNGDLLNHELDVGDFNYVCVSPKEKKIAERIQKYTSFDIKVVTDLTLNRDMLKYATMLMPLTTFDKKKDSRIKQSVWKYCVKHNKRFCLRQHQEVWKGQRGL